MPVFLMNLIEKVYEVFKTRNFEEYIYLSQILKQSNDEGCHLMLCYMSIGMLQDLEIDEDWVKNYNSVLTIVNTRSFGRTPLGLFNRKQRRKNRELLMKLQHEAHLLMKELHKKRWA